MFVDKKDGFDCCVDDGVVILLSQTDDTKVKVYLIQILVEIVVIHGQYLTISTIGGIIETLGDLSRKLSQVRKR